jgi:hypothetical protein
MKLLEKLVSLTALIPVVVVAIGYDTASDQSAENPLSTFRHGDKSGRNLNDQKPSDGNGHTRGCLKQGEEWLRDVTVNNVLVQHLTFHVSVCCSVIHVSRLRCRNRHH